MSDSDLTPDQDESVRALLASAKPTGPTPPEVVARLDTVLAELAAERREVRAPVVTLASRRRRRASAALVAAAAVVVLGVGVTHVLPSVSESGDSATGGGAESVEDSAANGSDRAFGANEPEELESQRSTGEKTPSFDTGSDLAVVVSTAPLRRQARALRPTAAASSSVLGRPDCAADRRAFVDQVEITYDGAPGVLVYRPPAAGSQQVDLFLCGEPESFLSVTIPAR